MKEKILRRRNKIFGLVFIIAVIAGIFFVLAKQDVSIYDENERNDALVISRQVEHIQTPEPVRAIYATGWTMGAQNDKGQFTNRERIFNLLDETELNAIVIDIKDYTGELSYPERIPDISDLLKEFHRRGVYVIGRVSVFQDQSMVIKRPDLAVRRRDNGGVWRDKKGIAWLDPGAREVWEYVIDIARDAYELGFDEINFDYIRFPSDGDMSNVKYAFYNSASTTRSMQMKQFYAYLDRNLRQAGDETSDNIPISADLFGMTTINRDDLGIGQVLENALAHFDFVAPMVYPSHYPPNFNGWPNPNKVPYDIVNFSMQKAVARADALDALSSTTASTTSRKLRPWLQDFQYGGTYGEAEVRAQKQAVYDSGLISWMMWDPSVRYTRAALDMVTSMR